MDSIIHEIEAVNKTNVALDDEENKTSFFESESAKRIRVFRGQ